MSALVDIVVVSYNSRDHLRGTVGELSEQPDLNIVVVDNDSPDGSLEAVDGLDVTAIPSGRNGGFSYGCNLGWRAGGAPYVLFLNPDARITPDDVRALARVLRDESGVGAAGPTILMDDGVAEYSQRRFPSLVTVAARAFFVHRLLPHAGWTDELVRDPALYAGPASPDWISGACLMVRREALERIGGFDEGFFMYCEDLDICKRVRDAGWTVRFEPSVVCHHEGGASGMRSALFPVLAESRLRYGRKHWGPGRSVVLHGLLAVEALIRLVLGAGGADGRRGHSAALRRLVLDARRIAGPEAPVVLP